MLSEDVVTAATLLILSKSVILAGGEPNQKAPSTQMQESEREGQRASSQIEIKGTE